jgi:hypothetical protein
MSVITTEQEIERLTGLTAELVIKLKAEKAAEEKTKRIISFDSKKYLADALVSGRTFKNQEGRHIWFDGNCKGSPFRSSYTRTDCNGTEMVNSWDYLDYLTETTPEPIPWYLAKNFMPVECYVSDIVKNPGPGTPISVIAKYCGNYGFKFIGRKGIGWTYATPTGN